MRLRPVLGWMAAMGVLPLTCCAFPTDESGEVFVTVESGHAVVVRGDTVRAVAHAWRRTDSGPPVFLPAVTFRWRSLNTDLAVVTPDSGLVTGLKPGMAEVTATPIDFEGATPGSLRLRIANTVEIDSVRPDTSRYGGQITVYGVGLGATARLILGGATLIPDTASLLGDPSGVGQEKFWVPYPATTNTLVAVAKEGFSAPAADTTFVVPVSIYAPTDSLDEDPPVINLDGPPIRPPNVLFYNPALWSGGTGPGEYLFVRHDRARALTVQVMNGSLGVSPGAGVFGSSGWSIGALDVWCRGRAFFVLGAPVGDTQTVALASLPDTVFSVSPGAGSGVYGLRILDGYEATDPRIGPDHREENDFCQAADSSFAQSPLVLTQPLPFNDTLTIDTPLDIDWLRFRVEGTGPQQVMIRTAARPVGPTDLSDLALGLATAMPADPFDDRWVVRTNVPGSSEQIATSLEPGDYYLVVSDTTGIPTRYALCMALGDTCPLLP